MKKIALILTFSVLLFSCVKEKRFNNKENDLFAEYNTQEGFAIMNLPPVLFKIVLKSNQNDEAYQKELLDKIDIIKVLIFTENDKSMKLVDLKNSLGQKIDKMQFNLLTQITEEGSQISIFVKDENNLIKEVLIKIISDKDLFCIDCIGEFNKEDAFKLYNSINTQSLKTSKN